MARARSINSILRRCGLALVALYVTLVAGMAFAQDNQQGTPRGTAALRVGQECQENGRSLCGRIDKNTVEMRLQTDLFTGNAGQRTTSRNICRYIDNPTANDLFIPLRDDNFTTFEAAAGRLGVTVDGCCLGRSETLTASTGETFPVAFTTDRDVSSGTSRTQTLSHIFTLARQDCADVNGNGSVEANECNTVTWQETAAIQGTCDNEAWSGAQTTDYVHTGSCVGGTWVANGGVAASGAPASCPPTCESTGTCSTTGDWTIGSWSECSNACGGVQTRSVFCAFDTCNGAMPATTQDCNVGACPPVTKDMVVFGSSCALSQVAGLTSRVACISNGNECQSVGSFSPGATLPMSSAANSGMFCSSVSTADSSGDGAEVEFDLSAALSGITGEVDVIAPMNMYRGIKTQAEADVILRGDLSGVFDFTTRDDLRGARGSAENMEAMAKPRAVTLHIPDVNSDAVLDKQINNFAVWNSGSENDVICGQVSMRYTAATKKLVVAFGKGCRWKKNTDYIATFGTGTYGGWTEQYRFGNLNGKVWSEVRVVAPPKPLCGSAHGDTLMANDGQPRANQLCAKGTASEVSTEQENRNFDRGTYTWTCTNSNNQVASCYANYVSDPCELPSGNNRKLCEDNPVIMQ